MERWVEAWEGIPVWEKGGGWEGWNGQSSAPPDTEPPGLTLVHFTISWPKSCPSLEWFHCRVCFFTHGKRVNGPSPQGSAGGCPASIGCSGSFLAPLVFLVPGSLELGCQSSWTFASYGSRRPIGHQETYPKVIEQNVFWSVLSLLHAASMVWLYQSWWQRIKLGC